MSKIQEISVPPAIQLTCREFIRALHPLIGSAALEVWSRKTKYFSNFDGERAICRDFKSSSGCTLTLVHTSKGMQLAGFSMANAQNQ